MRINISDLTLSYGKDTFLKSLSLKVKGPSVIKIYGSNGAGKTSLLRAIAGVFDGDIKKGSIEIEAQQTIKLLDNTPSLIDDLSVKENIQFFTKGALMAEKQQENLLVKVGMQEFQNDLVSTLSSGMKKRIEIAILIWVKPSIVCLDEPSNFLDDDGIQIVDYLIEQVFQNQGIVIYSSLGKDEEKIDCDFTVNLD